MSKTTFTSHLVDELPGEWRMTIAECSGTPTYHIRLIFEKNGAGIIGRQIIQEGDVREFYRFDIQEIISFSGERYETISFLRVVDGLDYEATFCYGNMLIGTHSNKKGNWQAIKLPYTSPAFKPNVFLLLWHASLRQLPL